MRIPAATYRLQLNADLPFAQVHALIDYFRDLGVGDLYFSPIFEARPHSPHGYDVTHPGRLNPEIGDRDQLARLSADLHTHGMGILIDVVPNHMAASEDNPWWRDVLIHGPASLAAHFFDIDWQAGNGRLILPVLGRPRAETLAAGELRLVSRDGGFQFEYFGRYFPLDPGTCRDLLRGTAGIDPGLLAICERIGPRRAGPITEREARRAAALELERQLRTWTSDEGSARAVTDRLERLSAEEFRALVDAQAYSLEFWRTGSRRINYRRFFDIADLAAVRVEDRDVFATTHTLILELIRQGEVDGVRVDHIDGLRDPALYLRELRAELGNAYVVVEKILAPKEELAESWPVEGTTGYDFIGLLAGLYCDPDGLARITDSYLRRTGVPPFPDLVYEKKKLVIDQLFSAELGALAGAFVALAERNEVAIDHDAAAVCISEVSAALHVYRTYINDEISAYDRCVVKHAVTTARHRAPNVPDAVYTLLRNVLLDEALADGSADLRARFIADWQQFTGPVMAKGSEDTAAYTYNALLALSEVGAHPDAAVASADGLHEIMTRRAHRWPYTMNASSTHDTKRSEDVRARIQTLTELPDVWEAALERWTSLAAPHRRTIGDRACPDENEAILIFQTLLGVWPLTAAEEDSLPDRLAEFLRKSLREAKQHSSWSDPDEGYEAAATDFVRALLNDAEFRAEFRNLQELTAELGALNSLSQLVLKLAAPGVPDIFQGNETWAFRLVDPDNRAAVDYDHLRALLAQLPREVTHSEASDLLRNWQDGRLKLHVTRTGLHLRRSRTRLFTHGGYVPIPARGRFADNVIAFARRHDSEWALAVAGRYYSRIGPRPTAAAWAGTTLELPAGAPTAWRNALTGEISNGSSLEAVCATLPFALLVGES